MWQMTDRALIPADVMAREVGEEVVLLNLATGTYFGLDSVGARAWQLIGEKKSLLEIREVLLSEYEVRAADLETDLTDLLDALVHEGLIRVERGTGDI
jgi:hypothetical protein